MIGTTVSHYRILEKLGEGGMGVVYRAEDIRLRRPVALKFLSSELTRGPEARKRFIREAQAASALDHPNICTVHEVDETDDGRIFIAMACYEGETLKDRIGREPLLLNEVLRITRDIAHGLAKAHEQGIVHRDIKPANIFLTSDGLVKILDFGLAKLSNATQVTQAGTTLGTVAYMSPEQILGEEVDARADLWSLGVVIYEMITGKAPFRGDHDQAVIHAILNRSPQAIAALRPEVPPAWQALVNRMLAREPSGRVQVAAALIEELRALMTSGESTVTLGVVDPGSPAASVAVLPFQDMSAQKDQDYFCEGIAEELINGLVQIEGLKVASRTSAFQFKSGGHDVCNIGRQLNVRTVLEGSIRKAGNRLRITAQLVDTFDGFHLWSEKYDREQGDIFAIQDEIALAIVDQFELKLLGRQRQSLVKRRTADPIAHSLYLKGLYFWNRRLEGGLKQAIDHFQQAIARDPGYALAHVGVADAYNILGWLSFLPPSTAFPQARAAAQSALAIDDSLGEPHASLGWVAAFFDWDWQTAEKEFRRAIDLNPHYATAHEWYAAFLMSRGRFDEAIAEITRAQELDPLSLIINAVVGVSYYAARRYDESILHFRKALEMDPDFLLANAYFVLPLAAKGMYRELVEVVRRIGAKESEHIYALGGFGWAMGMAGRFDEARGILRNLEDLARTRYVSPYNLSNIHQGLGQIEEAIDLLEEAYRERNPQLVFLEVMPMFDDLRLHPRFEALRERMKFGG